MDIISTSRLSLRRVVRLIVLVTLSSATMVSFTGCVTHILANRIVTAPNLAGVPAPYNNPEILAQVDGASVATWKTKVGPPDAEIAVSVFDPGDFQLKWDVKESHANGKNTLDFNIGWKYPEKKDAAAAAPKGTIVFLHGILMTRESMIPWALYFAQKQYRVVLVDLRGHGRSTGKRIGFGAWEVDDLMAVTNELERRGLLAGKLGVFGLSYGASIGLQWAARDPRVRTVVALTPYSDPRAAIEGFARGFDPGGAGKLSPKTFAAAEIQAAAIAGIRWSDLNIVDAVRRLSVPVLFFHGQYDKWIVPANSEALQAAAPAGSERLVTDDDHISLGLRWNVMEAKVSSWFEERLAGVGGAAAVGAGGVSAARD